MKWPIHSLVLFSTVECDPAPSTLLGILSCFAYLTRHDLSAGIWCLVSGIHGLWGRSCHLSHKNLNILSRLGVTCGFIADREAHTLMKGSEVTCRNDIGVRLAWVLGDSQMQQADFEASRAARWCSEHMALIVAVKSLTYLGSSWAALGLG